MRTPHFGVDTFQRVVAVGALSTSVAVGSSSASPIDLLVARFTTPQVEIAHARSDIRLISPLGGGEWVFRIADATAEVASATDPAQIDPDRIVDPSLHTLVRHGNIGGVGPILPYVIIPAERHREARRRLETKVRAFGGSAELVESDSLTMRAHLDPIGLARLVATGDILWVEPWSAPDTDDAFVRNFGGANLIESITGFRGNGVVVEVVDKGLFDGHLDLLGSSPVFRTVNSGPTDHGTSTYGIIFGSGTADEMARGMMPGQPGLFSSYLEVEDRYAHLATFANDYGGVIQSNSWGSGINRRYTALSAELDAAIFDHDVLVFQSQSNRGNPDSRPEAWAKNAISVGGINGWGTLDRNDDTWGGFASTGPAIDGRIKPDLTLFNDGILTTSDLSESAFELFTGTSAATPAVAGHAGIMIEMWRAGVFHLGDATAVPTDVPSVAMSRALLINTAKPYQFGHAADDLGRFRQGWGTPDLVSVWTGASRRWIEDESAPLSEGEGWTRVFRVNENEPLLALTLAWTELASMPFASQTLINDLDLRLISPSGEIYLGNFGLHDGVFSMPGGYPDSVNSLENIFIENPEAGLWQVDVTARSVSADTWQATPETDAAFALVITGDATGLGHEAVPGTMRFVGDIPETISPRGEHTFEFDIQDFEPSGSGELRIQLESGTGAMPLIEVSPGRYRATLRGLDCRTNYKVLAVLPTADGGAVSFPAGVGDNWLSLRAVKDMAEVPSAEVSWVAVAQPDVQSGAWERGTPSGGGLRWDPPFDADGDGLCWMTGNVAGDSGVTGGAVSLQTPYVTIEDLEEPAVEFDLWLASDLAGTAGEESMQIEVSYGFGDNWQPLVEERSTFRWTHKKYALSDREEIARLRFTVGGGDSHLEAAIDGLSFTGVGCPSCIADIDIDGVIDLSDVSLFLTSFFDQAPAADVDLNGVIDLTDLVIFVRRFDSGCDG